MARISLLLLRQLYVISPMSAQLQVDHYADTPKGVPCWCISGVLELQEVITVGWRTHSAHDKSLLEAQVFRGCLRRNIAVLTLPLCIQSFSAIRFW